MARTKAPGTAAERLVQHLLDAAVDDPLTDELAGWLSESARFHRFADAHRDKIRKKLRGARDAEARRDVRAELRAAHLLLADRRMELAFEAYGSAKGGPDFTVTYRGERAFNLEVTRLRRTPSAAAVGNALLVKLRQLPPSMPNAVLIAADGGGASEIEVAAATRALRSRADTKDDAHFSSRGFSGSRGFYERYLRLGAALMWCESSAGEARAALWTNRSARIALPEPAARACLLALRSE